MADTEKDSEKDEKESKPSAADKAIGTIPKENLTRVKVLCERLGKSVVKSYEQDTEARDERFKLISQILGLWPKCTAAGLLKLVVAIVPEATLAFKGFTREALARPMMLAGGTVNPKTKTRSGVKVKAFTLDGQEYQSNPEGIAAALKTNSEKRVLGALRKVKAIVAAKGRDPRTPEAKAEAANLMPHAGTDSEKFFERVRNSIIQYATGTYGFDTRWLPDVRSIMEATTKLYNALNELKRNQEKKQKEQPKQAAA